VVTKEARMESVSKRRINQEIEGGGRWAWGLGTKREKGGVGVLAEGGVGGGVGVQGEIEDRGG